MFIFFFQSNAFAECNFLLKIGDKKSKKFVEKFSEPISRSKGLFWMPVSTSKLCPNEKLHAGILVEYLFLDEKKNINLAEINMTVYNDVKNTISNNLILMNYAKKVYGDFDTGFNPRAYNNFYIWDKGQNRVTYTRFINQEKIIKEGLNITNKEYSIKLDKHYNQLEMEMLKGNEN